MTSSEKLELFKLKKIHFIGIGGIGMSGLARIVKRNGASVSGSDLKESGITELLKSEGIKVSIGHNRNNLPKNSDAVIITSAVKKDNPEFKAALSLKLPILKRAELLAMLCLGKKTIAVAGTHGKTTTTSMISLAMDYVGADSTNVIGGIFRNINSNIKMGAGEYFVTEADESDGTFLLFSPLIACITNIDSDHLDFYKNMENLKKAFMIFAEKIPFYGRLIACCDDKNTADMLKKIKAPYYSYGLSSNALWRAQNIKENAFGDSFDIFYKDKKEVSVDMRVFGLHNVRNALAAYIAVRYLGFDKEKIKEALNNFSGVKRRLELLGEFKGISFYDDYGHHPTEVENTILALKSFFPSRRLVVVFQPHRYSRTALLYKEFSKSFTKADKVYLTEIYPAGEKPIKGVSSNLIMKEALKNGFDMLAFKNSHEVAREIRNGDIVLSLGAGDVWKLCYEIKNKKEIIG